MNSVAIYRADEPISRAADIIRDKYHPYASARALADAGLLVTDEIQALIDVIQRTHRPRCPLSYGHKDDSRRRRIDCSDDQCVNPACVSYVECDHRWHDEHEALAAYLASKPS